MIAIILIKITQTLIKNTYTPSHFLYTKASFPPRSQSMSGSMRHSIGVADIQHPTSSKEALKRKKQELEEDRGVEWIDV